MVLISCGQKNNSDSTSETTTLKLDTLIADNYILTFESADSFAKTDIYGDLNYRTKLTDTIHNWGKKAEKIQSYLLDKFDNHFNVTDSTLVLSLVDGTNKILSNNTNEGDDYKHYYFQHYFDEIDYYLISVHLYEGGYWLLVNRNNGYTKRICGLPYILNGLNKIISINSDLEAGYSFNGIEFFTVTADSLKVEFRKETEWGPIDIKWVTDNNFLIKREHFHVDSQTGYQKNIVDYKRVKIKKKTSQ